MSHHQGCCRLTFPLPTPMGDDEHGMGTVPMTGVKVSSTVRDRCAEVELKQTFKNKEKTPIEALYTFPIDPKAAIAGFEIHAGDRRIKGEVQEKQRAAATYDDAISAGHGAYMLEQQTEEVFRLSVGNIDVGMEVAVVIRYVVELQSEGNGVRFMLPMTIAPKYTPASSGTTAPASAGDDEKPSVSEAPSLDYKFDAEIRFEMTAPVLNVESPTHEITSKTDGCTAMVQVSQGPLDSDFVILVEADQAREPHAVVERDDSGAMAALVSFNPPSAVNNDQELVFVVDRSGSMDAGSKMEDTKNALQIFLKSIPVGASFNIVSFGSYYHMLFDHCEPYNNDTLQRAVAYVKEMWADMQGTEILLPLQAIFEDPPRKPRAVFVLTDGQVSNTQEVIGFVQKHNALARVFTLGIGNEVDHSLVDGMAHAGGGASEFVVSGERMDGKVMRQLKRALQPPIKDVKIDWSALAPAGVQQAPATVRSLFAGDDCLVYAVLPGDAKTEGTVTVTATQGDQPLRWELPVRAVVSAGKTAAICKLAARAVVRETKDTAAATKLALRFQIASAFTAFVAVEERATPVAGAATQRTVPLYIGRARRAGASPYRAATLSGGGVPLPFDPDDELWDECDEDGGAMSFGSSPVPVAPPRVALARSAAPPPPAPVAAASFMAFGGGGGMPGGAAGAAPKRALQDRRAAKKVVTQKAAEAEFPTGFVGGGWNAPRRDAQQPQAESGAGGSPVAAIVAHQSADGDWPMDAALAAAMGTQLEALRSAAPPGVDGAVWATMVVIAYLKTKCAAERDVWDLVVMKADAWLRGRGVDVRALSAAATAFVKRACR